MILVVDPGIYSMGYATWAETAWKRKCPPTEAGLIEFKGNSLATPWFVKVQGQVDTLAEIIESYSVTNVICEMPIFMGSAGGYAAASKESTHKLAFLVGSVARLAHTIGADFEPITPREWKGQLPKTVVISRIIKYLGENYKDAYKADTWDAVGIGLWKMGVLNGKV